MTLYSPFQGAAGRFPVQPPIPATPILEDAEGEQILASAGDGHWYVTTGTGPLKKVASLDQALSILSMETCAS